MASALAAQDRTAERADLEALLDSLADDDSPAGRRKYKDAHDRLTELEQAERYELGRVARVESKRQREAEEARHAARVARYAADLTELAQHHRALPQAIKSVTEFATGLANARAELVNHLATVRLRGQSIKGSSLTTESQLALVDLAIMHQLVQSGFPLRGVGNDPSAATIDQMAAHDGDAVVAEIRRLIRGNPLLAEAAEGVEL